MSNSSAAFLSSQMVEMLLQYVDRSLKKCPEQGKIQVMEQHFQVMGHPEKHSQMVLF